MREFFIWCSGASLEIVKRCDDKEITKYSNIGIVVFCVAFLSVFSATYFLSFAFNTEGTGFMWEYLPIGVIWGFIILSLDRAIVSTISKNDSLYIQILKTIPRIALAFMIGIVVATPLEFKIFEKEVDNVINVKVEKIVKDNIEKDYNGRLSFWEQKVKETQSRYDKDKLMYQDEVDGKKSGIPGKGARANEYMRNELNSLLKLNVANDSLNLIRQTIVDVEQNINWDKEINNYKTKNIGVIERVKTLYSLGETHFAISVLFVLVELLPLLTKLMSNKGSYDQLIIDEEKSKLELALINRQKEQEFKDELTSLENKKQTQIIKLKQQIELSLQKEILIELSKAQNEIAIQRVQEFKQKNINDLNIPNTQNIKKFENVFWSQKNSQDRIEYYFRNGKLQDNDLIYLKEGTSNQGKWNYNQIKNEISIELLGNKENYTILEITPKILTLKYKDSDDIIELENKN